MFKTLLLMPQFDEMGNLTALVDKLAKLERPLPELRDSNYLCAEIIRIKKAASKYVLLFGTEYGFYVRFHLSAAYNLIINVFEILFTLPELSLMGDKERYQYKYLTDIKSALYDLASFFNEMN